MITLVLAAPTFAVALALTGSLLLAAIATSATLFGGLMFGPDLDIHSRQYTRWGAFRFVWLPYQVIFRHRSRWSHGIVFGTLIRVLYFAGVMALIVAAGVYVRALLTADGVLPLPLPGWGEVAQAGRSIEAGVNSYGFDRNAVWALLAGLWWGAASHTLTDIGWSIVRKASEIF